MTSGLNFQSASETLDAFRRKKRARDGSIPSFLPQGTPCAWVMHVHRQSLKEQYCANADLAREAGLKHALRGVALHEAAHAYIALRFEAAVRIATLATWGGSKGRTEIFERDLRLRHPDDSARIALAGYVANCIADPNLFVPKGAVDFVHALAACRGEEARVQELWTETVVFLTHPENWRAIVAIAEALLQHGHLDGDEIVAAVDAINREDPDERRRMRKLARTLEAARYRLLREGKRPYALALRFAVEASVLPPGQSSNWMASPPLAIQELSCRRTLYGVTAQIRSRFP